jgi:prepilin-type N-terminal cleavage/methylation domain-containing protein
LKKYNAFTLIELLVAMAIIAVLIALAIFGLASAQRMQRDTERKAAIDALNIGVQLYHEKANDFPVNVCFPSNNIVNFCSSVTCPCTGTYSIDVPVKGASLSLNPMGNALMSLVQASGTTSTQSGTAYCLGMPGSVHNDGTSNSGGYALCASLENGGVTCAGTGALKGNKIDSCGLGGIQFVIP